MFSKKYLIVFICILTYSAIAQTPSGQSNNSQQSRLNIYKIKESDNIVTTKSTVDKSDWIVCIVDKKSLSKREMNKNVDILMSKAPEKQETEEYSARRRFYEEKFVFDWMKNAVFTEEASSQGITVDEAEVQKKIDDLLKESGEKIELSEKLKQLNISEQELLNQIRDAIMTEKLIFSEINKKYTDDDFKKLYSLKPEQFQTPTMLRVSQIFKKFSGTETMNEKKKLKETFEDIAKKLKRDPSKFEEYVEMYSEDAVAKKNKGDLGWQDAYNLLPDPVNKEIFKMNVGEVSGIMESKYGVHIIKITDKKESVGKTFETAKPLILEYLYKTFEPHLFEDYKKSHTVIINASGIDPLKARQMMEKKKEPAKP